MCNLISFFSAKCNLRPNIWVICSMSPLLSQLKSCSSVSLPYTTSHIWLISCNYEWQCWTTTQPWSLCRKQEQFDTFEPQIWSSQYHLCPSNIMLPPNFINSKYLTEVNLWERKIQESTQRCSPWSLHDSRLRGHRSVAGTKNNQNTNSPISTKIIRRHWSEISAKSLHYATPSTGHCVDFATASVRAPL